MTPLPTITVVLFFLAILRWSRVLKHGYRVRRARPLPKSKQVSRVSRREWRRLYNIYMRSKAKREEAFAYYGRRCSVCGIPYDLHVHHKQYPPPELFGTEDVRTLQIVCCRDHELIHGRKIGR